MKTFEWDITTAELYREVFDTFKLPSGTIIVFMGEDTKPFHQFVAYSLRKNNVSVFTAPKVEGDLTENELRLAIARTAKPANTPLHTSSWDDFFKGLADEKEKRKPSIIIFENAVSIDRCERHWLSSLATAWVDILKPKGFSLVLQACDAQWMKQRILQNPALANDVAWKRNYFQPAQPRKPLEIFAEDHPAYEPFRRFEEDVKFFIAHRYFRIHDNPYRYQSKLSPRDNALQCLQQTSFQTIAKEVVLLMDRGLLRESVRRVCALEDDHRSVGGLVVLNFDPQQKLGWQFEIFQRRGEIHVQVRQLYQSPKSSLEVELSGKMVDDFIERLRKESS